jgi:lysophospholipase L1-like esterase
VTIPAGFLYADYRSRKIDALLQTSNSAQLEWRSSGGDACTLLLVGDSRVAQWPLPKLENWATGKLYRPGGTMTGLAGQARQAVKSLRPTVILVHMGVNDASAAALMAPADSHAAMERLIEEAKQLVLLSQSRGTRVVLTSVPAARKPTLLERLVLEPRRKTFIRQMNQRLLRIAKLSQSTYLDLAAILETENDVSNVRMSRDSLHWTDDAYTIINSKLAETINPTCNPNQPHEV